MVLLARGLPRDRFRVEVAALTRLGPLEADLRAAGVQVTTIGKRHKLDPLALARLIRLLRTRRFDVVQTWIFAANTYGRLAARGPGSRSWSPPRWPSTSGRGDRNWRSTAAWPAGPTGVVGNSDAVVDFYRKARRPRGSPGDDPLGDRRRGAARRSTRPRPRRVRLARYAPLVLFAGRLAEQKGVDDLLAALDLVRHVRPDVRTLIVGDGPLRGQLEETARAFELDGQVRFLGHRDDVPRLLAAADLLVLPSLYEGLPNVVLEAMRCAQAGRRHRRARARPRSSTTAETGLLVPVRNPPALAQAIRTVLQDPDLARTARRGRPRRVEAEFRAETMVGAVRRPVRSAGQVQGAGRLIRGEWGVGRGKSEEFGSPRRCGWRGRLGNSIRFVLLPTPHSPRATPHAKGATCMCGICGAAWTEGGRCWTIRAWRR